jgi:hypothetical protein
MPTPMEASVVEAAWSSIERIKTTATGLRRLSSTNNIAYSITPEPSEVVLLATGLLTLVGLQRVRRRGRRDL